MPDRKKERERVVSRRKPSSEQHNGRVKKIMGNATSRVQVNRDDKAAEVEPASEQK